MTNLEKATHDSRTVYVRKIVNEVLAAANAAGMIDDYEEFVSQYTIKISKSEGCHANASVIKMSTHDRYCAPINYRNSLAARNWASKTSWKRAVKFAKEGYCVFVEYSSIQKDKDIGSFITESGDPRPFIEATAAHEVAHSIHFWNNKGKRYGTFGRPHGVEWQAIYRKLRNLTANKTLRAQSKHEELPIAANRPSTISRPDPDSTCGRVWAICDFVGSHDRKGCILECISAGISPGTAATQYAKYKRYMNQ